jgi:hypothetical protein
MRYRYKPFKDGSEIFAKKSSLAIQIQKDSEHELKFYVYNRRTHSILGFYEIPLLEHCKDSWQNVEPIVRPKKKVSK